MKSFALPRNFAEEHARHRYGLALSVKCPTCKAAPGVLCRKPSYPDGIFRSDPHFKREVRGIGARRCRVCGCTDDDCRGCIERTGQPCHWIEDDLCSACSEHGVKALQPWTTPKGGAA